MISTIVLKEKHGDREIYDHDFVGFLPIVEIYLPLKVPLKNNVILT